MTLLTPDAQKEALEEAARVLRGAFPDLDDTAIVSQHLLPHFFGALPPYSNLSGYAVNKTTLAAVAATVVCYGIDPATKEPVVVLVSRKEKRPDGQHYHGHLGGYVNLDFVRACNGTAANFERGEQPHDGVIGEVWEETKDGDDRPLLCFSFDRLELLRGGVNYHVKPSVAFFSYTAELTGEEITALKVHADRFSSDEAYRERTLRNNGHEVFGIRLLSLDDAIGLSRETFLHKDAWDTFQCALGRIKKRLLPSRGEALQNGGTAGQNFPDGLSIGPS